jgi:hypothetical protein
VVLSSTPPATGPTVRVAAAQLRSHLAGNVLGEHTPLCGLVDDHHADAHGDGGKGRL